MNGRLLAAATAAPLLLLLCTGCLETTSEATFIGGRQEVICDGVHPACKGKYAGCVLNDGQYIKGMFPGARKVMVETPVGEFTIRVLLFLEERLAPGTETELNWFEPGCSDQYRYQLSKNAAGGDLFVQAGRDQVFEVAQPVVDWGEHLIEFWSDATCRYDMRIEVVKTH